MAGPLSTTEKLFKNFIVRRYLYQSELIFKKNFNKDVFGQSLLVFNMALIEQ